MKLSSIAVKRRTPDETGPNWWNLIVFGPVIAGLSVLWAIELSYPDPDIRIIDGDTLEFGDQDYARANKPGLWRQGVSFVFPWNFRRGVREDCMADAQAALDVFNKHVHPDDTMRWQNAYVTDQMWPSPGPLH